MAGFINISNPDARLQVFSLAAHGKTVRLCPGDAAGFIGQIGSFLAAAESGSVRDETFWNCLIVDFDGETELRIKLEIQHGQPRIVLEDELLNISLDTLAELASDCWDARAFAVTRRRRGTGMGALLGRKVRDQARRHAMRDQGQPQLDNYDRYIKRGDY